jgi:hypothetical protein
VNGPTAQEKTLSLVNHLVRESPDAERIDAAFLLGVICAACWQHGHEPTPEMLKWAAGPTNAAPYDELVITPPASFSKLRYRYLT